MADTDLLSSRDARRISGDLSESTVRRMVAAGEYPPPIVLRRDRHERPVRVAWLRGDVEEWCRARIAAARRDAARERSPEDDQ